MMWSLRFKQKFGLKDVQIETEQVCHSRNFVGTPAEKEARARAETYINSLGSPAYRFISVEPTVVASFRDDRPAAAVPAPPAKSVPRKTAAAR